MYKLYFRQIFKLKGYGFFMTEKYTVIKQISELNKKDILSVLDHTFLKAVEEYSDAEKRKSDFEKFLKDVCESELKPYGICVRPFDVRQSFDMLKSNGLENQIRIASVVGFHTGLDSINDKLNEMNQAINNGATEIDAVVNYSLFKKRISEGKGLIYDFWRNLTFTLTAEETVGKEIFELSKLATNNKVFLKLILETGELNPEEIVKLCNFADKYAVDMVKTSTGYSKIGATAEAVKIMKENFSRGIKISGGVKKENLKELLSAMEFFDGGWIHLDPTKVRIGSSKMFYEN